MVALVAVGALGAAACGVSLEGKQVVGTDGGGTSSPLDGNGGKGSSSGSSGGFTGDDASGGGGSSEGGPSGSGGGSNDGSGPPLSDGSAGGQCDFSGMWALKITIPVNWAPQGIMSVILAPGSGVIEQWILSTRTLQGLATTEDTAVCGITLPDFSGTGFVGGETYGVRFPDSLFDGDFIPKTPIAGMLSDTSPTARFTTSAHAVLIGLTLANATTASWPSTITTAVDTDMDNEPGVTAAAATGPIAGNEDGGSYQPIPVDPFGDRADRVYVAIRQVTALSGAATDCDHISGTVTIPKIQGASAGATPKYAIDSHVLGCRLTTGDDCSATQGAFVDGTQPVFSPTMAAATFSAVRLRSGNCASVRQALP
jgi:hypothetical protein